MSLGVAVDTPRGLIVPTVFHATVIEMLPKIAGSTGEERPFGNIPLTAGVI